MFAELTHAGVPIVVYASALWFKTERHHEMDGTILVTASEAQRVARVQQRNGCIETEVRARIQAQIDEAEKRRLADDILDNNSDIQELKRQVQDLVSTLRHAVGLAPHHP